MAASNGDEIGKIALTPNRIGRTVEYKRGAYYLSHTVWEDGHEEVEVHRCAPEQLYHSFDLSERHLPTPDLAVHTCDSKQFEGVFTSFASIPAEVERPILKDVAEFEEAEQIRVEAYLAYDTLYSDNFCLRCSHDPSNCECDRPVYVTADWKPIERLKALKVALQK